MIIDDWRRSGRFSHGPPPQKADVLRVLGVGPNGGMTRCPAHDDSKGSLSVTIRDGKILLHCFAGCQPYRVVEAAGLKWSDLFLDDGHRSDQPQQRITGTYIYRDASGEPVYRKIRLEPGRSGRSKEFSFSYLADGRWEKGRGPHPSVLYNLHLIGKADLVVITEGEKHADLLTGWGLTATTLDGGAGSRVAPGVLAPLGGKHVVILPDNDPPGLQYADRIARALHGMAKSVKVVNLPGLGEKEDIIDWAKHGGNDIARLLAIIDEAPEWGPEEHKDGRALAERAKDTIQWGEPLPFGAIKTPDIPCSLLPGWLGEYCEAIRDSAQVPSGLVVMMALSTVAACVQRRFEVSPYGDYREPLAVWTVTALDPGTRKTAVKQALTSPLIQWEADKARELSSAHSEIRHRRDIDLRMIDQLRLRAAKLDTSDSERRELLRQMVEIEQGLPGEVHPPRVWCDDITPEKLQDLLARHGERMALISDEGGVFEVMAGLYSEGRANINVYLQGHAGSPVRVDRLGRSVTLRRPALTFGLAVQPSVIAELSSGDKQRFRGVGALARFLYCVPRSTVGHRDVRRRAQVPPGLQARYMSEIYGLLEIPPLFTSEDETYEIPRLLTLDRGALDAWLRFSEYIESRLGEGGDLYAIQDWASKLPGAALRIAGLIHVAEHGERSLVIEQRTMECSLDLAELLIAHAQTAFDLMSDDASVNDAKVIYRWIVEEKLESFSRGQCIRKHSGRFRRVQRLIKALEVLVERNIISPPTKIKSPGRGRPEIVHHVNPSISGVSATSHETN